jgi:hypothetical protein
MCLSVVVIGIVAIVMYFATQKKELPKPLATTAPVETDPPVNMISVLQDADDADAVRSAVELAVDVAMQEPGVMGIVKKSIIEIARTIVVGVAIDKLAGLPLKAIFKTIAAEGGLRKTAAKAGVAAVVVLADTLYKCLDPSPYGAKRDKDTCSDQGIFIAAAIASPSSLFNLAKYGSKITRVATKSPALLKAAQKTAQLVSRISASAAKLPGGLASRMMARISASFARFSTRMAAVATKIGAMISARAATLGATAAVQAEMGPPGWALIVIELAFTAVSMALDITCQGNFSEMCHVDPEDLKRLSEDQRELMLSAIETENATSLLLEVQTSAYKGYAEAREYFRQTFLREHPDYIRKALGTRTIAEWFVGLKDSDLTPPEALGKISELMRFVNEQVNTSVYITAAKQSCAEKDGVIVNGMCTVKKKGCIDYMKAVRNLVGPTGSALSDAKVFATVQIAVLFTSSISLAVDLAREKESTGPKGSTGQTGQTAPPVSYNDDLVTIVAKALRAVKGRVVKLDDALAVLASVDAEVAGFMRGVVTEEDWTVVEDSFAARAKWVHESPAVRRESFRWATRANGGLVLLTPSETEADNDHHEGVCIRDVTAAMDLHVCPFIVADTRNGKFDYSPSRENPGHAVNWQTGMCTRTDLYCSTYDMREYNIVASTRGETVQDKPVSSVTSCSYLDDKRAVCTCGKSTAQKFGAAFVGDTIQGKLSKYITFTGAELVGL